MENKKNKIDSVIDEVLESKRLQQGSKIFLKVFVIGFVCFVLLGIILNLIK